MKIAVMQPYVFPYLGYFQLIKAVDTFVFYDDVNFINKGWINRNKILVNEKAYRFTIPLKSQSQFKLISETEIDRLNFDNFNRKFLKTINQSYKKAPHFDSVFGLIENFLRCHEFQLISTMSMASIQLVCNYLNINTNLKISSKEFASSKRLKKEQRLYYICKQTNSSTYINPIGGQELYHKSEFENHNINLKFMNSKYLSYQQFNNEFVSNLSIIDVLMFNSKSKIKEMLFNYELL